MKKLFLASSFADTYQLLPDFVGEELTNKSVVFIDTASHTEERKSYVDKARIAFEDLGLTLIPGDLFAPSIKSDIEECDYIYIAGGNTFYLMQELKKSGVDQLIINHVNQGKVYIGESAGTIIMSPNIEYIKEMDDITQGPELTDYTGFNIIDVYPLPHVGNKYLNDAVETIKEKYSEKINLHLFSDEEVLLIKE
ncbi:Type 1 glutamine amidotransferase-like domain-containing protein [Vagococcus fluvialis]|uniref:Type 1 glutamine amidotransferase-like domain-containing protein n=1 Tax=Vagococcus fluvialis TaxID=2738 RepID=UPI001A8C9F10|nr:Type 1 glutamine amidotransferase-like domain-containing protein [Vagococcus fluvialis]MBO0487759.1 Type 1 glutamine amidotransferase-like domain-containing protein [Vagococcus fluvialis]